MLLRFNGGVFEFHYTKAKAKVVHDMRVALPITLEDLYIGKLLLKLLVDKGYVHIVMEQLLHPRNIYIHVPYVMALVVQNI